MLMDMDSAKLKKKAYEIRKKTLQIIAAGRAGHTGGDLSETDILTVLFYKIMRLDAENPMWEGRDIFILSKGHCVEAYYAILADKGFFPETELETFSQFGTRLIGHPNNKVPGVEICSGALGHGLSVGVGMAIAAKMNRSDRHVYVLMGDGEQAEGSIWEAAMAASNYELDNLTAIIDRNHLQISGNTEAVMKLEPLRQKWEAFGFHVVEIDGHDFEEIIPALDTKIKGKPTLVLANTTKGKGVSYMENVVKWHHGVPTEEQLKQADAELNEVIVNG